MDSPHLPEIKISDNPKVSQNLIQNALEVLQRLEKLERDLTDIDAHIYGSKPSPISEESTKQPPVESFVVRLECITSDSHTILTRIEDTVNELAKF